VDKFVPSIEKVSFAIYCEIEKYYPHLQKHKRRAVFSTYFSKKNKEKNLLRLKERG